MLLILRDIRMITHVGETERNRRERSEKDDMGDGWGIPRTLHDMQSCSYALGFSKSGIFPSWGLNTMVRCRTRSYGINYCLLGTKDESSPLMEQEVVIEVATNMPSRKLATTSKGVDLLFHQTSTILVQ
jgi:hypothetical protein